MQDFGSMQGGVGGGSRMLGGERRLRPYPNQALKCPRCESLNTKFCYYNNYNLSQPRHFCKSCRRYWTKGGVLRNVPVGGGCRKAKRSKPKQAQDEDKEKKSCGSHSSSESSSLTNTNNNNITQGSAAAAAGGFLNSFHDSSRLLLNQTQNSHFELEDGGGGGAAMFGETASFTSLMTVSNPSFLGYNFSEISPFRFHHQQQQEEETKMQDITAAAGDQTVPVDFAGTALDWHGGGQDEDQGLFDLASNVVDQGYWSQTQWTDNHLYLPP